MHRIIFRRMLCLISFNSGWIHNVLLRFGITEIQVVQIEDVKLQFPLKQIEMDLRRFDDTSNDAVLKFFTIYQ